MPTKSKAQPSALKNLRGANKEARGRYLGDVARRERAATILNPAEVSGEYDAGRMLQTTLGGQVRHITLEDLRTFRANVKTAGKQFKGGITAKSVIDHSLPGDRDRANVQIRTAVPLQALGGLIHFVTNAGPDSDVSRHHVKVDLLNWSAALSSPSKPADMAKFVATGPLKFDCDCGRHTYFFRYIATIGKFNAGRDETGYPKIRNPDLVGVACKHVLRVMQTLSSPAVRIRLATWIEKGRGDVQRKAKVLSLKEAQEIADRQAKEANWKRNQVESSAERAQRLARAKAIQATSSKGGAASVTPAKLAKARRDFEANAKKLAAMGMLSPKQLAAMLAKIKP